MRQFLIVVASVVWFVVSLPPASAQIAEDKKTDTDRTNPFLNSESSEQLDLLQRYYQRIFSQQGKPDLFRLGTESQSDPSRFFSQAQAIGMEGPVNPAEYVVGPFDLLTTIVWGIAPFSYTGPVTPEGTLLVPTVGELAVAGNTLAEAKEKIREAVRKKYTAGDISVNLVSLRTFKVTVAGAVANPGAYTMSPVDRVDRVVYLANLAAVPPTPPVDQNREQSPPTFRSTETKPPPAISLRNIKLYRGHRDTVDVDLVRYYASGETRFNPYLRDGDIVFVPAENLAGNRISIYGGVRMPGAFEFHPGDSLRALLKMAQGPTALADLENVEVARFLPDGRQVQVLTVNLQPGQNGHTPDMALQPNDRVFIRENPELRKERMISIKGEVSRPGEYAIVHGQTMLSDVIGQAGGFTPEASIAEAKLIRNYDNPDELQSNPDYTRLVDIRLTDLKPEDRQYFNYETAIKRGFVAVDFLKLFNHHEKTADVVLWDGDEIYIPFLRHTVNVFGQVNNPGHVTYVDGMKLQYYVEKAGNFAKEANRGKVRILKRDTKAWIEPGDTKIEPGDEIFVSRKVHRPAAVVFRAMRDVLLTAASVATVVLLYRQASK